MRRLVARRPSPSMVVALLALVAALGGSAYAALSLPRNSVGTVQLRTGAVTNGKLHAGAVTASKVRTHSLLARDFKAGQLPAGPRGATGLQGAMGLQGPPGQPGPPGPGATSLSFTVPRPADPTVATVDGLDVKANCSSGGTVNNLTVATTPDTNTLEASGTEGAGTSAAPKTADTTGTDTFTTTGSVTNQLDVVAANTATGGKFVRIDADIENGAFPGPCAGWVMITPSS